MKSTPFNPLPEEIDLLLDAFFAVGSDSTIHYASKGAEIVLGYPPEELVGIKMLDLVHPDDRQKTASSIDQVMLNKTLLDFDNRYIRKDGKTVHLHWSTSWSEQHQLRLGVARDISRIKSAEVMQNTLLAISEVTHRNEGLPLIYPQIRQILCAQFTDLDYAISLHFDNSKAFIYKSDDNWQPVLTDLILNHAITNRSSTEIAIALQAEAKKFGLIVFKMSATKLTDTQFALLQFTATHIATALERQQMLERLQHMALYDSLTDLPNRQLFHDRLLHALALSRREQHSLAVLYLDLDKFKQANDRLGHSAGDALLRDVAIRICACVRESDTVVRFGGDEFVILLGAIENRLQALTVAEKIRHSLSQTFYWQKQAVEMSASIGVAVFPEQGDNAEKLLTAADNAMYRAKKSGKNCVR